MIVDAHVHVASPEADVFPRQPTGVGSDWWRTGGSVESLIGTLDANGVERAIVVQAIGVYSYDCRYAASAVAEHPDRLSLVGAVDMDSADPAAAALTLSGTAPLRGLRLFGVTAEPRWLGDGRADAVWEFCTELGITVVPTLFAHDLGPLHDVVARHPGAAVALDHCAFVEPDDAIAVDALLALADLPSLTLKVTSHVLAAATAKGDPARFIEQLVDAFGPDRLCWGSDFPQHHELTYPDMLRLARHAMRNLPASDQRHVFGATASRLWWPRPTS